MKKILTTITLFTFSIAISQAAITYIDANTSNTTESDGTAFTPEPESSTGADNQWEQRAFGNNGTIYESNGERPENAPALVTKITGLTSGEQYNVFGYFWSNGSEFWRIKGSLTPAPGMTTDPTVNFADDPSVSFTRNGTSTSTNAPAVGAGLDGSDNLGVPFDANGFVTSTDFTNALLVREGNRNLYQVNFGTATAQNGEISVYIDDQAITGRNSRTWYDGVGFEAVPEPSASLLLSLGCLSLILRRCKVS